MGGGAPGPSLCFPWRGFGYENTWRGKPRGLRSRDGKSETRRPGKCRFQKNLEPEGAGRDTHPHPMYSRYIEITI